MLEDEAASKALAAVDKKARTAWSKRRYDAARTHHNMPPGAYGRPMLEHDMKDQILDSLHLGLLNMPKIAWKYAILNNCSDRARELIDAYLKTIKHPLDTRRKEDNRNRAQKWYSGERLISLLNGHRGSPGGPMVFAKIVFLIAEDLQSRGVDVGAGEATPVAATASAAGWGGRGRGQGKGRGRAHFAAGAAGVMNETVGSSTSTPAAGAAGPSQGVRHVPSAMEEAADPEHLRIIREVFGSARRR
jgi:hypothetical protein